MQNFKKRKVLFPAVMFLCGLVSFRAAAANAKITFSDPSVKSGSEVNVTMKVSADAKVKLGESNVTVSYPADKLEFVSGTDADGGAGIVRIHGAGSGAGTSVLEYNLKFRTALAGTYAVSVETREVYDKDGNALNIVHTGSASVTVTASEEASSNAALSSLEISPGALDGDFSADVTQYSVTVGKNVERLEMNAIPEDPSATVMITGNDALKDGSNEVVVAVTAPDGVSVREYHIRVVREEGGSEEIPSGALSEGVQLYSRGKTITIVNPESEDAVPEGFRSGTISIDGQKVKGWVWGAGEDPQYIVVYGMNDAGELNFYRYDRAEKTIQRYFEDPLSADSVTRAEFDALKAEYDASEENSRMRFLIICILAAIAFALLLVIIVMSVKISALQRDQQRRTVKAEEPADKDMFRRTKRTQPVRETETETDGRLLKHDFSGNAEEEDQKELEETQVIRRTERRRRTRRIPAQEENSAGIEVREIEGESKESSAREITESRKAVPEQGTDSIGEEIDLFAENKE